MKAVIQTLRYIMCPKCGKRNGSIDHLQVGQSFGPWYCQDVHCGFAVVGTITVEGVDIEPARVNEERRQPRFALLKFRDLFLVYENQYSKEADDHMDFFFHSHQCPTNLFKGVCEVFDQERNDPHGKLRLVAEIPWTPESEKELKELTHTTAELLALFKTDGTPAPTEWPEEYGGVIPWIAEMQRAREPKKGEPDA